ncbi:MAG TPA: lysophospholipid acyltransferase family protein [Nitrospirota bacterium]
MRALIKWLVLIPLVVLFALSSGVVCLLPVDRKGKRAAAIKTASFFSRIMLGVLGIRVHARQGSRFQKTSGPRLLVANHVSYIDVLALASLSPAVFITSVELKHSALLGPLARLSGSIFVERRSPSGLKREINEIARVLGQGLSVVLFPEGTTSNGDSVRQFKNSLFDSAIAARAEIQPLHLRYTRVNGQRLTTHNRDRVFYYGGAEFLKHFAHLLTLRSIDLEILPLKPIPVKAGDSRKDLAAAAHQAISTAHHA